MAGAGRSWAVIASTVGSAFPDAAVSSTVDEHTRARELRRRPHRTVRGLPRPGVHRGHRGPRRGDVAGRREAAPALRHRARRRALRRRRDAGQRRGRDRGWAIAGSVVGVNNNTDFYRAVREGTITSTATPLHRGRSQQVWVVESVREDGAVVSRGQVRLQNLTDPVRQHRPAPSGLRAGTSPPAPAKNASLSLLEAVAVEDDGVAWRQPGHRAGGVVLHDVADRGSDLLVVKSASGLLRTCIVAGVGPDPVVAEHDVRAPQFWSPA